MGESIVLFGPDAEVLLLLFSNGRMKRSAFQRQFGMNYNTALSALDRIEELDLAEHEALCDRRDTVFYELTDKGRKAARMLAELDEFIRSG
jgi:DNA-binding MarR family transcriptional regulator